MVADRTVGSLFFSPGLGSDAERAERLQELAGGYAIALFDFRYSSVLLCHKRSLLKCATLTRKEFFVRCKDAITEYECQKLLYPTFSCLCNAFSKA